MIKVRKYCFGTKVERVNKENISTKDKLRLEEQVEGVSGERLIPLQGDLFILFSCSKPVTSS
jgi:hypothetical protein